MLSHRRINTALNLIFCHDLIVEGIAHAVQALKFKPLFIVASKLYDNRSGVGVVRSKLRIDSIAVLKQAIRTGVIRHIC